MRVLLSTLAACLSSLFSLSAAAQTVIYQDDFEAGASGWSNNTTENAPIIGTNFLGRFTGGSTDTSRTFTVPTGSATLDIEFDLLRFDSWDFFNSGNTDGFSILIDGAPIFSTTSGFGTFDLLPFGVGQGGRSGTTGNVDWSHTPINPTAAQISNGQAQQELGFNSGQFWFDQIHRFNITVNNPGATVALTLRLDLDQTINDESGGYDNFLVTVPAQSAPEIVAVDNDFTAVPIPPGVASTTASIFANDTLNGAAFAPTDVSASITDDGRLYGATINADGTINVPTGTVPGIYEVEYEICDVNDSTICDTAIAIIAVRTTTADVLALPQQCGGWTTQGWLTFGPRINDINVMFNSGNYRDDPYLYEPIDRDAQGRIVSYMGTPDETGAGAIPDRPGSNLITTSQNTPAHMSEYHRFVHRLGGAPNSSETIIYDTVSAAEFTAYWIEDNAGNVLESSDFRYTRALNGPGESFPITINYPADGEVFLHSAIFDPTAGYGRPVLEDYECPEPSLSITKVADQDTNLAVGDVITYTYTAENTGNVDIEDVTISDVHGGVGALSAIAVGTLTNTSGESSDNGTDGDLDVLAPGDSATFTSDYTVLLPDLLAGGTMSNTATATGAPTAGTLTDPSATETVNFSPLPPSDTLARPSVCGAYSHAGWSVPGGPFINTNILFGSGDALKDPYIYAGLSRDASGKVATYYGAPDHTDIAASGNPARFEIETHNNTSEPYVSEYHNTIYRLEGVPGNAGTITFKSAGGADNMTAWIEDEAGSVIANSTSDAASDDGWVFDTFNETTLNFTYPADGVAYLYGGLFDPSGNYGGTEISGFECPAPSLSMTKVADNPGPYLAGDVVTYTYTVTNDGNVAIQNVAISDAHNGSDPAPIPGNETLLTDAAPAGDSTDAATDNSWDILAPGDTLTFTGTYTITQTDAETL